MVTPATLDRLAELEQRLDDLGLDNYRDAVDEALRALGRLTGLPRGDSRQISATQQRRMLALGSKANRGALTAAERAEYEALIRESERRSAKAALAALARRTPERAAALGAEAAAVLGA